MVDFKYHYTKPKSLLRELIQKLFLKILKRMFSNKFWTYKNKIIDFNKIVIKIFEFDKINIPIKKMMQKKSEIGRYIIKIN